MKYKIIFEKNADKQLQKLDITQQRIITNWIIKNLENTDNPRQFGKALKGNLSEYWRYRIGDYRLIARINDLGIEIIVIEVGHRKNIYK